MSCSEEHLPCMQPQMYMSVGQDVWLDETGSNSEHTSAKNMTYIPNEGVDMYGDAGSWGVQQLQLQYYGYHYYLRLWVLSEALLAGTQIIITA